MKQIEMKEIFSIIIPCGKKGVQKVQNVILKFIADLEFSCVGTIW